jgi:acetyl-CoA C-acetyltransferase
MRDAVICEPVRTPVGRFGGALKGRRCGRARRDATIRALLDRTGVPDDAVDDVLLGQAYADGEAPAIGRVAALDAGLPVTVPGLQVDRRCGSGLQAVCDAAMRVQTGVADVVLAGGVESMSQVEFATSAVRWGARSGSIRPDGPVGAGPGDGRRVAPPRARRDAGDGGEPAA